MALMVMRISFSSSFNELSVYLFQCCLQHSQWTFSPSNLTYGFPIHSLFTFLAISKPLFRLDTAVFFTDWESRMPAEGSAFLPFFILVFSTNLSCNNSMLPSLVHFVK